MPSTSAGVWTAGIPATARDEAIASDVIVRFRPALAYASPEMVKAAEARGDFEVLAARHRRLLRVHLGAHVAAGLTTLKEAIRQALA